MHQRQGDAGFTGEMTCTHKADGNRFTWEDRRLTHFRGHGRGPRVSAHQQRSP